MSYMMIAHIVNSASWQTLFSLIDWIFVHLDVSPSCCHVMIGVFSYCDLKEVSPSLCLEFISSVLSHFRSWHSFTNSAAHPHPCCTTYRYDQHAPLLSRMTRYRFKAAGSRALCLLIRREFRLLDRIGSRRRQLILLTTSGPNAVVSANKNASTDLALPRLSLLRHAIKQNARNFTPIALALEELHDSDAERKFCIRMLHLLLSEFPCLSKPLLVEVENGQENSDFGLPRVPE